MDEEPNAGIILVFKDGGVWNADMRQTKNAGRIQELFGTVVLPIPFRDKVPASTVVSRLKVLNPGCTVRYRPPGQEGAT